MENNNIYIIDNEWVDDPKGHKSAAWIDLIYQYYKDGQHWMQASVKFDGCIHLRKAYNTPFPKDDDDQDYIHICDIDEQIKLLTLLKEAAIKHFGEGWDK